MTGKKLKREIKSRGYTIKYVAEQLGYSYNYITKITSGQSKCSEIFENKLAKFLEKNGK